MKNEKDFDRQIEALKQAYPLEIGLDNAILRTPTPAVEKITPEIRELGLALQKLVWAYEGVGIAAPQVGQSVRMAVITQRDMSHKKRKLLFEDVIINPVILGHSDYMLIDQEACLSLPGRKGDVARRESITVKYTRLDGTENIIKADDYNARIILHEMDHLDGVLFVDRM